MICFPFKSADKITSEIKWVQDIVKDVVVNSSDVIRIAQVQYKEIIDTR